MQRHIPSLLVSIAALAGSLHAQCATAFVDALGLPGVSGSIAASTMWDPDGTGPEAPLLVVGGAFDLAGATAVQDVATYEPATRRWASLGATPFHVQALAVLTTGELVAAGLFADVVKWDGAAWVPLGGGHNGSVRALLVRANGDLIAGGEFSTIGGVAASHIARWDGTAWASLGAGVGNGWAFDHGVFALAETAAGELVAAGNFASAGGAPAKNVARWNGTTWSALGSGLGSGQLSFDIPRSLLALPGGDVVAGGGFGPNNIARWNGTAWVAMGSLGPYVYSLRLRSNGTIVAGGSFPGGVATWSGSAWIGAVGLSGGPAVLTMTELSSNSLAVCGIGPTSFQGMRLWNGTTFTAPADGISGLPSLSVVAAATVLSSGDVVVGGWFDAIAGVACPNLARWDGSAWHSFGSGANDVVWSAGTLSGGDLVVGGDFTAIGGTAVQRIARWNGSTWSPLGIGANGRVLCVLPLPGNQLIVSGEFTTIGGVAASRIARWNGIAWTSLGSGLGGPVKALARLANGDVIAAGGAGSVPNSAGVHRWNGAAWTLLGSFAPSPTLGAASVSTLVVRANGDLLAGGVFSQVNGVAAEGLARWDGSAWSDVGTPTPFATRMVVELPDGDLLAGLSLQRRDGTTWHPIADPNWSFFQIVPGPDGTLTAVGATGSSALIARMASTCPATSVPQGLGCPSSGGANTLVALSPPWVDATFRAQGSGLPGVALVVAVTSLTSIPQAVVPLQALFAQAPAGCDLLVAPDILHVLPASAGIAESSLFLPNAPPLVGVTFFHQMVPFEFDAFGNVAQITATNALQLKAGML